jgi:hypothetical protein
LVNRPHFVGISREICRAIAKEIEKRLRFAALNRAMSVTPVSTTHARRRQAGLLKTSLSILAFFAPLPLYASTYYVAPTGSDTAAGTQAAPWATIGHAQTVAVGGDTVYFRAGKYAYTQGLKTCASGTDTINAILLSSGGKSGAPIKYWAYPRETPVFDFSGIKDSCRVTGFRVTGSWMYFKGLELALVRPLSRRGGRRS